MLGERLKQARIEAGLSQRQLCGEEITRNMLSQIESGKAKPSMQTLTYLAQKLERPLSWFLEEQTVTSPNQQLMAAARQNFAEGQYSLCLEQLAGWQEDPVFHGERWLLAALSLLALARQAICDEKHIYARSLLAKAEQAGRQTVYFTPALERERLLLLYQAQPEAAAELVELLPADDRELLLRGQAHLSAGAYAQSAGVLSAVREQDVRYHYLMGQALLGQKQYAPAAEHFLLAQARYPLPCAQALEVCYRELEDYKMAYYYACKQRQV